jgi:hypothetical protein
MKQLFLEKNYIFFQPGRVATLVEERNVSITALHCLKTIGRLWLIDLFRVPYHKVNRAFHVNII